MERILADSKISIADKQRCIQAFADRYPSSEKIAEYQQELNQAKKRRRRVRVALAAVLFLILGFGAYLYDRLNYDKIQRLAAEKPQEALTKLKEFQKWHPTRHLFAVTTPQEEEALERQLQTSIVEHRKEELVARLRAILKDSPLAKFDEVLTLTAKYRSETKAPLPDDLLILEADCRERAAETDLEELQREEGRLTPSEQGVVFVKNDPWIKSMNTLVTHADGLLKKHASTRAVSFIRKARDSYLSRLDEHDYDIARAYSRRNPQSFQTRLERYRTYLERHPQGAYVTQVKEAIEAVDRLWDKHDFRAVRDHFRDKPKELKTLVALSEKYLLIHPKGKYRSHANELLRWAARVKGEREYQVTLVRGDFDSGKTRRWYTKGPDFAITIEVNGVRYGPSSIVKNNYHPEWKYTFPRPIRWKMGDKVRIIAIDYDYWNIKTLDHSSREGDVLSMCLLSGRTHANGHTLYFSSDFWVPKMPVLD
mgnify:CR=1 FL=1